MNAIGKLAFTVTGARKIRHQYYKPTIGKIPGLPCHHDAALIHFLSEGSERELSNVGKSFGLLAEIAQCEDCD